MGLYDAAWDVIIQNNSSYELKYKFAEGFDWSTLPSADSTIAPKSNGTMKAATSWDNSNGFASSYNMLHFVIPGYPHTSYWAIWVWCHCDLSLNRTWDYRAGWTGSDGNKNSKTGTGIKFENIFPKNGNVKVWAEQTSSDDKRATLHVEFSGDDFGHDQ